MLAFHCFRNDPAYPLRRLNQMPVGEVGVARRCAVATVPEQSALKDCSSTLKQIDFSVAILEFELSALIQDIVWLNYDETSLFYSAEAR